MSIEASWDLRSTSSPRSLCVYSAVASSQDTNPFEVASGESQAAQAVVLGTERGSLHYRTYAPPPRGNNSTGLSGPRSTWNLPQPPLGITSSGRPPANLPRAYFPVDLAGVLPGSVVSVIHASSSPSHRPVFLVLVDDNRGPSAAAPGAYTATLVTLQHGSFSKIPTQAQLPRMSCATFHPSCGFIFAAGRNLGSILPEIFEADENSRRRATRMARKIDYSDVVLPAPGVRGGKDALEVTFGGRVAIIAVGTSVYAVAGTEISSDKEEQILEPQYTNNDCVKVLSFAQSSQVHPLIVLDVKDQSLDHEWNCIFLANGRECAVVDIQFGPVTNPCITCSLPRNGVVTLASPILAGAASWPWLAVLTSDGLVSIRSPSCMAIPLKTVEVGTRPNDFFILRTLRDDSQPAPWITAISYSGEGKVLQCKPDTAQDLADRLMRHSIDAFGANGFPRSELAEAVQASFTATSYVGPEPTPHARELLRQYLEAVLGLTDFESGGASGWPTEIAIASTASHHGAFDEAGSNTGSASNAFDRRASAGGAVVTSTSPPALLTGTALLCLVCTQLSPPKSFLANRAAKACAEKLGVIIGTSKGLTDAAVAVSGIVADRLLQEATNAFSLLTGTSSTATIASMHRTPKQVSVYMELVEATTWLLRASGRHERAIDVLYDRLQQQRSDGTGRSTAGVWSQIKYESYTATHLSELWGTSQEEACHLVLHSTATQRLLENNPRLGLSVFTAMHPQNETQWRTMNARDDPLAHPTNPSQVVKLLKSTHPVVPFDAKDNLAVITDEDKHYDADNILPLDSGRALAISFLESAIGISTNRPTEEDEFDTLPPDEIFEERVANFHDELCYLLLEGVIAERGDGDNDKDTKLGEIYREKLRRLLRWPLAKIRSERLLSSLPKSFLQEQALVLGRLGRHEDALRILYCDLQSMKLALEYCDLRHERKQAKLDRLRPRQQGNSMYDAQLETSEYTFRGGGGGGGGMGDCAYLPLVRVALESDSDRKRGTAAAIQVLALRRGAIDRAAALRLLPDNVPVSAVARPFLIPALVDSESQVRRLTVVSSLLRARYVTLKHQLTDAQLKAQATLQIVPQLRPLNLGDPLHSTKPFKARPSSSASPTFPDVVIVKHFFPRHLVIQAKVTNNSGAVESRALGDVAFVVAESSEEAIQPSLQVPIKALPFKATGSAWCVLGASPQRMEGTAMLTCELRYTVLAVDATTGAPLSFGIGASGTNGRTFVEELQDLEVFASHFS